MEYEFLTSIAVEYLSLNHLFLQSVIGSSVIYMTEGNKIGLKGIVIFFHKKLFWGFLLFFHGQKLFFTPTFWPSLHLSHAHFLFFTGTFGYFLGHSRGTKKFTRA